MFGDSTGNAVVVEWIEGLRKLNWIKDNHLVMTNFLLSDSTRGNYPCYRYQKIVQNINSLSASDEPVSLLKAGNLLGGAAQPLVKLKDGRTGGTLYSTFIDISNMQFVLVYKLDNSKITKLNLQQEFQNNNSYKIKLK